MRIHIQRNHNAEDVFEECKACGKKLKASSMHTHITGVHQQLRKHKCDLCDNAFKTASSLTKHKFTHTKTRPFSCNLCPIGYYSNINLRKHFERVHQIVYNTADVRKICGKKDPPKYVAKREQAKKEATS